MEEFFCRTIRRDGMEWSGVCVCREGGLNFS